jgi:hypothetical protein
VHLPYFRRYIVLVSLGTVSGGPRTNIRGFHIVTISGVKVRGIFAIPSGTQDLLIN